MAAARITQLQSFMALTQMLVLPLFFLSGALYPVSGLPPWLEILNRLDPLTYAVDPMRKAVFAHLDISQQAREALNPGVTWFGWRVPTAVEDAYYFELGCFVFFELDVWHFSNSYDDFRDIWYNDWIANKFIGLFQKSMRTDHLEEVLENRLNLFTKIKHEALEKNSDSEAQRKEEWERISFFFEQFALRALKTNKVEMYDPKAFPVWIDGFLASFAIKSDLGAFAATMLLSIIKAFRYVYEAVRKATREQETGIKENTKYCQKCEEYVAPSFHGLCPQCDGPL